MEKSQPQTPISKALRQVLNGPKFTSTATNVTSSKTPISNRLKKMVDNDGFFKPQQIQKSMPKVNTNYIHQTTPFYNNTDTFVKLIQAFTPSKSTPHHKAITTPHSITPYSSALNQMINMSNTTTGLNNNNKLILLTPSSSLTKKKKKKIFKIITT